MTENINPWTIEGAKIVYDNSWIKVTEYDVLNPAGGKGIYGKVHFKNIALGIVALDAARNIYLIGQYRFALNEYSWEIPEGGGPVDKNILESAQRELLEEAGLIAESWKEILKMHLSNSVSDEVAVVFLATNLKQEIPSPEETEQLAIKKLPFNEALKMAEEGKITDSISVAAIFKVQLMILRGDI